VSTRNDDATIYSIEWNVEEFFGCCGAEIVFRLKGRDAPIYYGQARNPENVTADNLHGYIRMGDTCGMGFPCWVGFAGVLSDIYPRYVRFRNRSLFFASDNYTGVGDTHNGPFSTRNFIEWLRDNDLANITEWRTSTLVGYIFTFGGRGRQVQGVLRSASTEFRKLGELHNMTEERPPQRRWDDDWA
jgi:hypothetical protein